jgi:hypothetical protein
VRTTANVAGINGLMCFFNNFLVTTHPMTDFHHHHQNNFPYYFENVSHRDENIDSLSETLKSEYLLLVMLGLHTNSG